MQVSKEEFEEFIKNYNGPGGLFSWDINFVTPNFTVYCDFGLCSKANPGVEQIMECIVAEHTYSDSKGSEDIYEIYKTIEE